MIVTFSNEHGAGAVAIARDVARELGYTFVDEQLPVVVAKRLQASPEDVEATEDAERSVGERILTGLELATPEISVPDPAETFDQQCLREVQSAVREYAAHGDVVLVGRAAGVILGRREDVLRIFVHAPREWRVQHIASSLSVDERTAAAEVDRVDAARRHYVKRWYDMRWGDIENYDVAIDASSFGHDACVTALVGVARARS